MKILKNGLMNKIGLIPIAVALSSRWEWIIISKNIWVGILTFLLSVVVFLYFSQYKFTKLLWILIILTTLLVITTFRQAFDESIFRTSALDIQQYYRRHEYYASGLGKIYTNRFALFYFKNFNSPIKKLQRNIFENLDINLYFFSNHPRERLGVEEFEKYSQIFLPFFLIGVLYFIYVLSWELLIYTIIVALLSSTISPKYELGPILFFPLINYFISNGIILSLRKLRK